MRRITLASIFAFALAASAISFAAGTSVETPLGQCVAGGDTITLSLREDAAGKSVLVMAAGNATSRQSFNLQTPCLQQIDKTLAAPLKFDAIDAADSNNLVAGFGTHCAAGDTKWVSVWLSKSAGHWTLRGEWSVEKFNHQELGEKNESQTFAFDAGGILRRSVSRNNIEGIKTTCPQGCCIAWQSKTMVTEELETLAWTETTQSPERKTFQKWYIAQFGDGVMSIAKKVHGDPSRMTTLLRLNPQLQKQEKIEENQKVLVEQFGIK